MIFWQNYTFIKKNKIACLTIRETILDNKNKLPEIAEKLLRSNLPPLIFRLLHTQRFPASSISSQNLYWFTPLNVLSSGCQIRFLQNKDLSVPSNNLLIR
jgi:hypothetical protein